jgi:hypothetical protein
MEQDKQLKQILLNSTEGASADFTNSVMKKVYALPASSGHQPLVSRKLKKVFVLVFGITVGAILSLCLAISFANQNIASWIESIPLPQLDYKKLLLFILIFWILFSLNMLVGKKLHLHRTRNV